MSLPDLHPLNSTERVAEFFLLGQLTFDAWQALQRRLAYAATGSAQNRMVIVCCEHPPLITVGRNGSRAHIRMSQAELERAGLAVRWVTRGGGVVLHGPGQLAIYPIASLPGCGWTVDEFMSRFHGGLQAAVNVLGVQTDLHGDSTSLWTRRGWLAATGVGVADRTTTFGSFLNVNPPASWQGHIDTASGQSGGRGRTNASSLVAERRRPVRMTEVRTTLVEQLAKAFECDRFDIHTAHPWLKSTTGPACEHVAHVR